MGVALVHGSLSGAQCRDGRIARTPGRAAASFVALYGLIVTVVAGCGAGVNEDLVATATPYPVRSPVAPSPDPSPAVGQSATLVAAGRASLAVGDWIGAERAFDRALLREPGNAVALAGRAEARLARGDLGGATADLESLLDLDIVEPTDLRVRAELRLRFGDEAGAEEDFSEAIARDPSDAAAMAGRGLALVAAAAGDRSSYDLALADFSRALAIDPDSIVAKLGPILVLADRAEFGGDPVDWQRAADEIDALGATVPGHDARRAALAVRVWLALDRPDEARQALEPALSAGPVGPDLARLRAAEAAILFAEGEMEGAEIAASAAIAADPLCWEARRLSIAVALERGAFDAALAAADQLLRLRPGDGQTLYGKGLALAGLGRRPEAREVLMEAGSAMEASPVYQAKVAEAIDALESGRRLEGTPANPIDRLGGEMAGNGIGPSVARRSWKGMG